MTASSRRSERLCEVRRCLLLGRLRTLGLRILTALMAVAGLVYPTVGWSDVSPDWQVQQVDSDDPQTWPAGEWVPVPAGRLRGLVADNAPHAYISEATYDASLDIPSDGLPTFEGTFRWRVDRPDAALDHVLLGRPNVALYDLRSDDQEALWGMAVDGTSRLLAERGIHFVTGRWLASGVTFGREWQFRFELPPALATDIRLSVPAEYEVRSENAIILQERGNAGAPRQNWTLRPSRGNAIDVTVVPKNLPPSRGAKLVSRTMTVRVDELEQRWRADLEVEFIGDRPSSLPVVIPPFATLAEVLVNDVPVTDAAPIALGGRPVLLVPMPKTGAVRVRLRGRSAQLGELVRLPTVIVPDTQLKSGRVVLTVARPMQLERVDATGFRQIEGALDNVVGDRAEFVQTASTGEISIRIGPPPSTLSGDLLTLLDLESPVPELQAYLDVRAETGSEFDLDLDWPAGWTIVNVTQTDGRRVEQWTVTPVSQLPSTTSGRSQGRVSTAESFASKSRSRRGSSSETTPSTAPALDEPQRLHVTLARPLTPNSPAQLIITARASRPERVTSLSVPRVSPQRVALDHDQFVTTSSMTRVVDGLDNTVPALSLDDLVKHPFADVLFTLSHPSLFHSSDIADAEIRVPRRFVESTPAPDETPREAALAGPLVCHADVDIQFRAGEQGVAFCTMTFRFPELSGRPLPQFVLPSPARWGLVRLDDQVVNLAEEQSRLSFAADLTARTVVVDFTVPITNRSLTDTHTIPLPRLESSDKSSVELLTTHVTTILPDHLRHLEAAGTTKGSWSVRFLGPLARPFDIRRFNPWRAGDWPTLFDPAARRTKASSRPQTQTQFYPVALDQVVVTTFDPGRALAIGWVALLGSLMLICCVRSRQRPAGRLVIVGWLFFVVAVACFVPLTWALPWGGLVCGTWLALLVPHQLLSSHFGHDDYALEAGSTIAQSGLMTASFIISGGCLSTLMIVDRAVAETDAVGEMNRVLVPAGEFPLLPETTVYVSPATAASAFRPNQTDDFLIRRGRLEITPLDDDAVTVDATFDIVRHGLATGVRVPLSAQAVVDPTSFQVDGQAVTPLPVGTSVFVPVAGSTGAVAELKLRYQLAKPNVEAESSADALAIPLASLCDGVIERDADAPPLLPASCRLSADRSAARVLPKQVPVCRLGSINVPATPRLATGRLLITDDELCPTYVMELTVPDLPCYSSFSIRFPRDQWVEPDVNIGLAEEGRADAEEPADWSQKVNTNSWSRFVRTPTGPTVHVLLGGSPLRADRVIRARGSWPQKLRARDFSRPTVQIRGETVPVEWEIVTAETASSTIGSPTPWDRESIPELVSLEQRGRLTDANVQWETQAKVRFPATPTFTFPLQLPPGTFLESLTLTADGRDAALRTATDRRRVDVLLERPVSGDVDMLLKFRSPRSASRFLPLTPSGWPEFDDRVLEDRLTLENRSSDVFELLGLTPAQRLLWDETASFEGWPESGPLAAEPVRVKALPELTTLLLVDADRQASLHFELSSPTGPVRRTITLPEAFRPDGAAPLPAAPVSTGLATSPKSTFEVRLTTTSAGPTSKTVSTPMPLRPGTLSLGSVSKVKRESTYVFLSAACDMVIDQGLATVVEDLPASVREQLPESWRGTAFRVRSDTVTLSDAPTSDAPALASNVEHVLWPVGESALAGRSTATFLESGRLTIETPEGLRLRAVQVNGVATSEAEPRVTAGDQLTLWWSGALVDGVARPPSFRSDRPGQWSVIQQPLSSPRASFRIPASWQRVENTTLLPRDPTVESVFDRAPSVDESIQNAVRENGRTFQNNSTDPTDSAAAPNVAYEGDSTFWLGTMFGLGLFAVTIAWITRRQLWGTFADQLDAHPRLVTVGFGLFWWWFLLPSGLGVLIVIVALWLAIFRPRSATAEVVVR